MLDKYGSKLAVAYDNLCNVMDFLPGILVTGTNVKYADNLEPYIDGNPIIFFEMDTNKIGSIVLSRCMSGRYSCYHEGEMRTDPQWKIMLSDTEAITCFALISKDRSVEAIVKLTNKINGHIDNKYKKLIDATISNLDRRCGGKWLDAIVNPNHKLSDLEKHIIELLNS